jgi:hypothetical protein
MTWRARVRGIFVDIYAIKSREANGDFREKPEKEPHEIGRVSVWFRQSVRR